MYELNPRAFGVACLGISYQSTFTPLEEQISILFIWASALIKRRDVEKENFISSWLLLLHLPCVYDDIFL